MRLCVFVTLLTGGCSPDPVVGQWGEEPKILEFHDDGTLTGIQPHDPHDVCAAETAALAACARKSHWERSGSTYRITLMGLTPHPTVGFGGMFAPPKRHDDSPCDCVEFITSTAELHGDELVFEGGKERVRRVKR